MHVDLYWFDLDGECWPREEVRAWLSEDERARVDRLLFERDRQRALIGWAGRRAILGRLVGMQPRSIRFGHHHEGRPYLLDSPLQFNLSHSQGRALLAVSSAQECLGVDIECLERKVDRRTLGQRFFHPFEIAQLRDDDFSPATFFRIWTAKEAYLKALGTGLRRPLDSFSVVDGEGRWSLCQPPGEPLAGWHNQFFVSPAGNGDCVGHLTVAHPQATLRHIHWSPLELNQ